MKITQEEYNQLLRILKAKSVRGVQLTFLTNFARKNIDSSIEVCGSCAAQQRFLFRRIENWEKKHRDAILEHLLPKPPKVIKRKRCLGCNELMELTDKKKYYCDIKCYRDNKKEENEG